MKVEEKQETKRGSSKKRGEWNGKLSERKGGNEDVKMKRTSTKMKK